MSTQYIDIHSGAELHGDRATAENLLNLFMQQLDRSISEILQLYASGQLAELYEKVHGLCGAACYSSTPALLQSLKHLNILLSEKLTHKKTSDQTIAKAVADLEQVYLGTVSAYKES